jgi:hypothetical protein
MTTNILKQMPGSPEMILCIRRIRKAFERSLMATERGTNGLVTFANPDFGGRPFIVAGEQQVVLRMERPLSHIRRRSSRDGFQLVVCAGVSHFARYQNKCTLTNDVRGEMVQILRA